MGAKVFQHGLASTLLVSAVWAGVNDDFPPAIQRAEEIRQANRCALEQLPAEAVPSRGTVRIEAEVVPIKAGQEVQLRRWDASPGPATTNLLAAPALSAPGTGMNKSNPSTSAPPPASLAGAAAFSNEVLPANSAGARAEATTGSSIHDRIVNRPLPIGRSDEAP